LQAALQRYKESPYRSHHAMNDVSDLSHNPQLCHCVNVEGDDD
jgi:hypothetical protein